VQGLRIAIVHKRLAGCFVKRDLHFAPSRIPSVSKLKFDFLAHRKEVLGPRGDPNVPVTAEHLADGAARLAESLRQLVDLLKDWARQRSDRRIGKTGAQGIPDSVCKLSGMATKWPNPARETEFRQQPAMRNR